MGSALLDSTVETTPANAAGNSSSAEALRLQVAERLAAHRSRRGPAQAQPELSPADARQGNSRAARIAATVAERYAKSPSYRAMLAAEAERAVQQARAAAEVAARNARAVAAAQQQLLDGLHEEAAGEDAPQDDISQDEGGGEFAHVEIPQSCTEEFKPVAGSGAGTTRRSAEERSAWEAPSRAEGSWYGARLGPWAIRRTLMRNRFLRCARCGVQRRIDGAPIRGCSQRGAHRPRHRGGWNWNGRRLAREPPGRAERGRGARAG